MSRYVRRVQDQCCKPGNPCCDDVYGIAAPVGRRLGWGDYVAVGDAAAVPNLTPDSPLPGVPTGVKNAVIIAAVLAGAYFLFRKPGR